MKRLFIDLYLDEDVDVLLAGLLRARGFQVMTTQEAGQIGRSDEEQMVFASQRGKTILTHNRLDFEALARRCFENQNPHHGIIIAVRRPPKELARRLLALLNSLAADEVESQIIYI